LSYFWCHRNGQFPKAGEERQTRKALASVAIGSFQRESFVSPEPPRIAVSEAIVNVKHVDNTFYEYTISKYDSGVSVRSVCKSSQCREAREWGTQTYKRQNYRNKSWKRYKLTANEIIRKVYLILRSFLEIKD